MRLSKIVCYALILLSHPSPKVKFVRPAVRGLQWDNREWAVRLPVRVRTRQPRIRQILHKAPDKLQRRVRRRRARDRDSQKIVLLVAAKK